MTEHLTSLARKLIGALAAQGAGIAPPDDATLARLVAYVQLVESWNKRVDLTAARTPEALTEVLLADACVLARPGVLPQGVRLADIGTGAGAPVVPLVVLRPDAHASCIEPRRKRVAFLRTVIGQLGLVSRMVVHEQLIDPDAPSIPGGAVDFACSRATFSPERWLDVGLALAPRVAVLVAREPLPDAPSGVVLAERHEYVLPWSKAPRVLGVYARS